MQMISTKDSKYLQDTHHPAHSEIVDNSIEEQKERQQVD